MQQKLRERTCKHAWCFWENVVSSRTFATSQKENMWIAIEDITTLFFENKNRQKGWNRRKTTECLQWKRNLKTCMAFCFFRTFLFWMQNKCSKILNHWNFDWDAFDVSKKTLCIHRRCLTANAIHGSWKWRWVAPRCSIATYDRVSHTLCDVSKFNFSKVSSQQISPPLKRCVQRLHHVSRKLQNSIWGFGAFSKLKGYWYCHQQVKHTEYVIKNTVSIKHKPLRTSQTVKSCTLLGTEINCSFHLQFTLDETTNHRNLLVNSSR